MGFGCMYERKKYGPRNTDRGWDFGIGFKWGDLELLYEQKEDSRVIPGDAIKQGS